MKFSCEKAILLDAAITASRAVSTKSTIQALEGVLVEVGDRVTFTGYNLETGIRSSFDAEITRKGSAVINARLFADIIRKLPDETVVIEVDERNMCNIRCGPSEFNVVTSDTSEFPEMPSVSSGACVKFAQGVLRDMIGRTVFAVSTSDVKPVSTGELFEISGGELTIVACDGFRLAVMTGETREGGADARFIVPGAALREVERILGDSDEDVSVRIGERHVMFDFGDTILVSRTLEGEFINYRNAIQRDNRTRVKVSAKELIQSVERVSLITNERMRATLRCTFGEDSLSLTCTTALGRAYDECSAEGGADIEIGFNHRYLLDALKAVPDEEIMLELGTPISPCNIMPAEGTRFTFMVLPVRIRAGE